VRRADNLTTFMCQLSRNLGASTSWNPKGLSRPVMGFQKKVRRQALRSGYFCKILGRVHVNKYFYCVLYLTQICASFKKIYLSVDVRAAYERAQKFFVTFNAHDPFVIGFFFKTIKEI
jgi:hypothetical protein